MFIRAIEVASKFTRPIHSIIRTYDTVTPFAGAATLMLVNAQGWALTCGHVGRVILDSDPVNQRYLKYCTELRAAKGGPKSKQAKKQLAAKFGYTEKHAIELRHRFVGCVDMFKGLQLHLHPTVDIALIRFDGFTNVMTTNFPVFAKNGNDLKQGKFLCRLGFPFPEFENFSYDPTHDRSDWTTTGRGDTPLFPIEGMVTRHVGASQSSITGFELSTPGLRGQSGGPAVDVDGRVWGMQASTNHLDLDFDVDGEVLRSGQKKKVRDSAFLHVGIAVHVETLKDFMRTHKVSFDEG